MLTYLLAMASALVAGTAAQTTSVTSLFLYGAEGENIVASVISVAPEATSYFINCAPGTDSSDCGFGPGMTFVDGPSTFGLHVTEDGAFTMNVDCKIESEVASCTETAAGPQANNPGIMIGVFSHLSNSLSPVTITAGLDLIVAGATATAAGSSIVSGTAEPTASASSGPSRTGNSASVTGGKPATSTSASASASSSASNSTMTNGATAGAGRSFVLAGIFAAAGVFIVM